MDVESRQNKVDGLEAIKNKALDMAAQGKDSLEVRDFVTNAKKEEKLSIQMNKNPVSVCHTHCIFL